MTEADVVRTREQIQNEDNKIQQCWQAWDEILQRNYTAAKAILAKGICNNFVAITVTVKCM